MPKFDRNQITFEACWSIIHVWNNSAYRPIETTPFFNASLPVEKHLARAGLTFPRMFPQKVGLKLHTWDRMYFLYVPSLV